MPRGTQLKELINRFRDESGHANSRSLGQNEIDGITALLRRTYRRLHIDYEWPHLFVRRDKELLAGERYYSFPADLSFDGLTETVVVKEVGTDIWYPMRYGIDYVNYNTVDSESDERRDLPYSWEVYEDAQFEVWPIPESSGHLMRFVGRRAPKPLTAESDTLDIDDDLVLMYALGEYLIEKKSPRADMMMQLARQHYLTLRGNSDNSGPINMKVSQDRTPDYRPIDIRFAERRGG